MVGRGPVAVLNLRDQPWLQPAAFSYLLCRKPLTAVWSGNFARASVTELKRAETFQQDTHPNLGRCRHRWLPDAD